MEENHGKTGFLLNHSYMRRAYRNAKVLLQWIGFAVLSGVVVGSIGGVFALCLRWATDMRNAYSWLLFLLPAAGLAIVALYRFSGYKDDGGTNRVISSLHKNVETPFRVAPLIFIGTILTHLFGGSAGREGAALQMGGSIGNFFGKIFHLEKADMHLLIMCGMSAAFAALFGTPMAAAIFSMEIVSVGVMYYTALVPCVLSALIAAGISGWMGVRAEAFPIQSVPKMTLLSGTEIIILGILCAGLSIIFCIFLHKTGELYRKYLVNPYLRVAAAGILVIGLTFLVGSRDYLGAGTDIISRAIVEGQANPPAFALKILFTAITIEAGFKGGEIVPSFFVGATFGCVFGQLVGLSPSLCAAMGMIAVFCGVTNCPVTSILIGFEVFGFEASHFILLIVAISYAMSGYYGLYDEQTIVYSKYKSKYINRNVKNTVK